MNDPASAWFAVLSVLMGVAFGVLLWVTYDMDKADWPSWARNWIERVVLSALVVIAAVGIACAVLEVVR